MSTFFLWYSLGAWIALAAMAMRLSVERVSTVAILVSFWPLVLGSTAASMLLHAVGWRVDIDESTTGLGRVGFRRPDDGWPGFAVWVLGYELRIWKARP